MSCSDKLYLVVYAGNFCYCLKTLPVLFGLKLDFTGFVVSFNFAEVLIIYGLSLQGIGFLPSSDVVYESFYKCYAAAS